MSSADQSATAHNTFNPAYHLAIVSVEDVPIYELEYSPPTQSMRDPQFRSSVGLRASLQAQGANRQGSATTFASDVKPATASTTKHLNQFIFHASLDNVDEAIWQSQSLYICISTKNVWKQ